MIKKFVVFYFRKDGTEDILFNDYVTIDDDTTCNDILNTLHLKMKRPFFLINNTVEKEEVFPRLDFYYDDGVLRYGMDTMFVKINDFPDYGYDFNTIKIGAFEAGGLGAAGHPEEFFDFLMYAREFVQNNPLMKAIVEILFNEIANEFLNRIKKFYNQQSLFEKALHFKKSFNLDSFTKAFSLGDIREGYSYEEYFSLVNAFLTVYHYQYDYENCIWNRK